MKTRSWPFACFTQMTENGNCVCLPGRKYGNLLLFKSLCPDTTRESQTSKETCCLEQIQTVEGFWRPRTFRLLGVGLMLTLTWSAIGFAFYRVVSPVERMEREKSILSVRSAEESVQKGEFGKALLAFDQALKFDPLNANLHHERGKCLVKLKRFEEALQSYKRSAQLLPDQWEWHLEIAKLASNPLNLPEISKEHSKNVIEIVQENSEAHLLLAYALYNLGEKENALNILEGTVRLSSLTSQDYTQIARLYKLLDHKEQSKEFFTKASEVDPENIPSLVGMAYLLGMEKKWKEAGEILDNALRKDPENLNALVGKAELLFGQEKFQEAIHEYEKILQVHPSNPKIATRLAELLLRTHVVERGMTLLKKVVQYYPEYPEANMLLAERYYKDKRYRLALVHAQQIRNPSPRVQEILGLSYVATQKYEKAIEFLSTLGTEESEDFAVLVNLAFSHLNIGDHDKSLALYQKAQARHPESAIPDQFIGYIYRKKGQIDEAVQSFRNAQEKDPNDPSLVNNLAVLLVERGKMEDSKEAYALMSKIFDENKDDAMIADSMGWILFKRGEIEKAKEIYTQAIKLDPYLPDPYYHLGEIFVGQNETELAKEHLEKALKLSSEFDGAEKAKELLKGLSYTE